MYVLDFIWTTSFVVCRTPYLLCLLQVILTALKLRMMMFRWKTVGMLVSSFSLPATCVQREGDPWRMQTTDTALMTSVTTWSSSAHLRSWNFPSAGRWSVLGWPSCMRRLLYERPSCMRGQEGLYERPRRLQLRRSGSCAEQRLAGVARLIGNDGKWSVVVNIHRRVCTVSIHISTSMY